MFIIECPDSQAFCGMHWKSQGGKYGFLKIEPLPYESTRDYAYRFIKSNILFLKLLPGCPLAENDVASFLSISRTPVREAFIKLSQEDLVEIIPQKGTKVTLINLDSVDESIFLRKLVEDSVIN